MATESLVTSARKFKNPPINEIAISASFAERNLISDYEIGGVHALFKPAFPKVQRAPATPGPDVLPSLGFPPLNVDPQLSRWWLSSQDDSDLIQIQENFVALNWRRRSSPNEPPNYPGYDVTKRRFRETVSRLREWHSDKGTELPEPIAYELLYDDFVPVPLEGDKARLSSVLKLWPKQELQLANWSLGWIEPIGNPDLDKSLMRFDAVLAAIMDQNAGGSLMPILRLSFVAMGPCATWEELGSSIDTAHEHITQRFLDLIEPSAQASWGVI